MKKIFILLFLFYPIIGSAQEQVLQRELDKQGNISFMVFDNSVSSIPLRQAKKLLIDTLKLKENDDLVLLKETKDELGFIRQSYEQQYKGIKVKDGLYGVHSRNGKIEYIGGEYKNVKEVITNPSLSEKQALQKALDYINAKKYKWENPEEEKFIKSFHDDSIATFYPKGELLIWNNLFKSDSIYRLAYKFDIYAEIPFLHKLYYIDAISGEVLDVVNLIFDSNVTGTAETRYSDTQTITGDSVSPTQYRLRETRNGVRIETYNMQRNRYYTDTDFTDNDNNWTAAEHSYPYLDDAALDAHWGLEKVYDYWHTVWGRNSLDDKGHPLLNYAHADLVGLGYPDNDNAFWDGDRVTYGDGQYTMLPVVSLDIVAHETGHGIMQFTSGFNSGKENMALNEGFSDIWGAVIEHWAAPNDSNKATWFIGEQIMQTAGALRSMSYPNDFNLPDTYQGTYWVDVSGCSNPTSQNDYCSSHINLTVLDHWFYLLSVGGAGWNNGSTSHASWNDGYYWAVSGIGIEKAAGIVKISL